MFPDQRLPKSEIIRKRKDFKETLQDGKRWSGRYLSIFYKESDVRQVAFSVPRRVGKAVKRNRIKRLMREVYRRHKYEIGRLKLILVAKNSAVNANFLEIEKEIEKFIQTKADM